MPLTLIVHCGLPHLKESPPLSADSESVLSLNPKETFFPFLLEQCLLTHPSQPNNQNKILSLLLFSYESRTMER